MLFRRLRVKFKTWINPDGSHGGEVAEGANVEARAFIERYAFVLPGSVIKSSERVYAGSIIDGENKVRFDRSVRS